LQIDETVKTSVAYQSKVAAAVLIQDEVFTENAHLADGTLAKLREGCDRDPIAAHKLTARRSGTYAGQTLVCFGA
jgi:hypothetical protein